MDKATHDLCMKVADYLHETACKGGNTVDILEDLHWVVDHMRHHGLDAPARDKLGGVFDTLSCREQDPNDITVSLDGDQVVLRVRVELSAWQPIPLREPGKTAKEVRRG